MNKVKEPVDLNNTESKELLLRFVESIQKVDSNISMLKQERADIFTRAKDDGFNKKLINQVITDIRKRMKADELELTEKEVYEDIIIKSRIITLV